MPGTLSFTYDTLVAQLQDQAEDASDEFVNNMPAIVAAGESRCYTDLNLEIFDRVRTGVLTVGSNVQAIKAASWQGTRSLHLRDPAEGVGGGNIELLETYIDGSTIGSSEGWADVWDIACDAGQNRLALIAGMMSTPTNVTLPDIANLVLTLDGEPLEYVVYDWFQTSEVRRIYFLIALPLGDSDVQTFHEIAYDFSGGGFSTGFLVSELEVTNFVGVDQDSIALFYDVLAETLDLNGGGAINPTVLDLADVPSGALLFTAAAVFDSTPELLFDEEFSLGEGVTLTSTALATAWTTSLSGEVELTWDFGESEHGGTWAAAVYFTGLGGDPVLTGRRRFMRQRTYEYCIEHQPDPDETGVPLYFSEHSETEFFVSPAPDQAYGFELREISREAATALSPSNQSTWLATHAGDLLLAACMIESERYLQSEGFDIDKWKAEYQERLAQRRITLRKLLRQEYQPALAASRPVPETP